MSEGVGEFREFIRTSGGLKIMICRTSVDAVADFSSAEFGTITGINVRGRLYELAEPYADVVAWLNEAR